MDQGLDYYDFMGLKYTITNQNVLLPNIFRMRVSLHHCYSLWLTPLPQNNNQCTIALPGYELLLIVHSADDETLYTMHMPGRDY